MQLWYPSATQAVTTRAPGLSAGASHQPCSSFLGCCAMPQDPSSESKGEQSRSTHINYCFISHDGSGKQYNAVNIANGILSPPGGFSKAVRKQETGKLGKAAALPVAVHCLRNKGERENMPLVSQGVQMSCLFLKSASSSSLLSLISSPCCE